MSERHDLSLSFPMQRACRGGKAADQADDHAAGRKRCRDIERERDNGLQGKQIGKQSAADLVIQPAVSEISQDAGEDSADQADQHPFDHEGHLDEMIACADIAHDGDLLAARVDGRADRAGDQIGRQQEQQDHEDEPALPHEIEDVDELRYASAAIDRVIHKIELTDRFACLRDLIRVDHGDEERVVQRVLFPAVHRERLSLFLDHELQLFILGGQCRRRDIVHLLQDIACFLQLLFRIDIRIQGSVDLQPALDVAGKQRYIAGYAQEDGEQKQRDDHRHDCGQGHAQMTEHPLERLPDMIRDHPDLLNHKSDNRLSR